MHRNSLLVLALLLPGTALALDADGDGYDENWDCDDADPLRNFSAQELPNDGRDSDCNGSDGPFTDSDGDGLPNGFEMFIGSDPNNADSDGDGLSDFEEAHLDTGAGPNTDANFNGVPAWADSLEGPGGVDADGDGFPSPADCDDGNASVHPGATEQCDFLDNDCDGAIDEGAAAPVAYWDDFDGDGYGTGPVQYACVIPPTGTGFSDGDCNDNDIAVSPASQELCNNIDDDCDGSVDEALQVTTWYRDDDQDGFGDPGTTVQTCADPGSLWVMNGVDCDDNDIFIHPGVLDPPGDGIDQDCDGVDPADSDGDGVSDVVEQSLGQDTDGDGTPDYLDPDDDNDGWLTIDEGLVDLNADGVPDHLDPSVPGLAGVDSDFDGIPDFAEGGPNQDTDGDAVPDFLDPDDDGDGCPTILEGQADADGDGIPAYLDFDEGCGSPVDMDGDGFPVPQDCDDSDPSINPAAPDLPLDGIDQDCDGVDAGLDDDGDGYESGLDCDDSDPDIYPGAPEECDGVDNDCDGLIDGDDIDSDGTPDLCDNCPILSNGSQSDLDGDGLGDACDACPEDATTNDPADCMGPGADLDGDGYLDDVDCDDTDPTAFPGAPDPCDDGIDQDCNGVDETCEVGDTGVPTDDDDDDGPKGCTGAGAGATFSAIFLPLLFGRRRR